jgi:hypothetical protein
MIIQKLIDHVFERTDHIVDWIDKCFWQKSLALITRSFCIQLKDCSSSESLENWQNVSGIKVNILSIDTCMLFNVLPIFDDCLEITKYITNPYPFILQTVWFQKNVNNNCPSCLSWLKKNVCFMSPSTDLRSQKSSVGKVDKTSARSIELPL